MATIKCGLGQPYSSLAIALLALNNGDTLETYGPYAESNQTVTPPVGLIGVTWRHYGGDYTFDGTGATATFLTLAASNTNWTVGALGDNGGRVKATGYIGANTLVNAGASNVVGGFRLTANGAVGVYQITAILTGNGAIFDDILIDNPVDPTNKNWIGIYLNGASGNVVRNCVVEDVTITGAGRDIYAVAMASATTSPVIRDTIIRRVTAPDMVYAVYGSGANGYITVERVRAHALTGDKLYGIYVLNRSALVRDGLTYDFTATTTSSGIYMAGTQVDAVDSDSFVENCTVVGTSNGLYFGNIPAAGTRTVRNCISSGGTATEFYADAGAVGTSKNNCAAGGLYSANFPNGATDLSTDPLFRDAVNNDYRLSRWSPCVDSGIWIPNRTGDLEHQPISGRGMDRGAYEFQQANSRDVRQEVEGQVSMSTRDVRRS